MSNAQKITAGEMTNRTITIRFRTDKAGREIAHYWGAAKRWLPIGGDEARLKLATDPRYVSQQRAAELESTRSAKEVK